VEASIKRAPLARASLRVVGTKRAGLEYLNRDAPEVGRTCSGGEMVDLIELSGNVNVGAHIVVYVLEVWLTRS
jgi:hypothetical protein